MHLCKKEVIFSTPDFILLPGTGHFRILSFLGAAARPQRGARFSSVEMKLSAPISIEYIAILFCALFSLVSSTTRLILGESAKSSSAALNENELYFLGKKYCVAPYTGPGCVERRSFNSTCSSGDDRCHYNEAYGIVNADCQRWLHSQHHERATWDSSHATSDRNKDHADGFDYYKRLPTSLGHVLEIGAGPFTQSQSIATRYPETEIGAGKHMSSITLVDPNAVHYANKVRNCYYRRGYFGLIEKSIPLIVMNEAAENLLVPSLETDKYDTIIMVNTIEHVYDALIVLAKAVAMLKLNGTLIWHERYWDKEDHLGLERWKPEAKVNYVADREFQLHPIRIKNEIFDLVKSHFAPIYENEHPRHEVYLKEMNIHADQYYFIGRKLKDGYTNLPIHEDCAAMAVANIDDVPSFDSNSSYPHLETVKPSVQEDVDYYSMLSSIHPLEAAKRRRAKTGLTVMFVVTNDLPYNRHIIKELEENSKVAHIIIAFRGELRGVITTEYLKEISKINVFIHGGYGDVIDKWYDYLLTVFPAVPYGDGTPRLRSPCNNHLHSRYNTAMVNRAIQSNSSTLCIHVPSQKTNLVISGHSAKNTRKVLNHYSNLKGNIAQIIYIWGGKDQDKVSHIVNSINNKAKGGSKKSNGNSKSHSYHRGDRDIRIPIKFIGFADNNIDNRFHLGTDQLSNEADTVLYVDDNDLLSEGVITEMIHRLLDRREKRHSNPVIGLEPRWFDKAHHVPEHLVKYLDTKAGEQRTRPLSMLQDVNSKFGRVNYATPRGLLFSKKYLTSYYANDTVSTMGRTLQCTDIFIQAHILQLRRSYVGSFDQSNNIFAHRALFEKTKDSFNDGMIKEDGEAGFKEKRGKSMSSSVEDLSLIDYDHKDRIKCFQLATEMFGERKKAKKEKGKSSGSVKTDIMSFGEIKNNY